MIVPDSVQTAASVALHYDELDPAYRRIWGEHVHHGYWRTGRETSAEATEALADFVAARLRMAPGQSVCDIGCGYGATAARFARRHGVRVVGLTLSASQRQVAVARGDESVTYLCRDWLNNDLSDETFDHAYAIESSEHMVDKARFFAEAARVLKPGGRLVVCAWLEGDRVRPWEVSHLLKPICAHGRLPSMGSRADYESWAGAAGLALESYEDISRSVRRTWTICARRLATSLVSDRVIRRLALSRQTRSRSFMLTLPLLILALQTGAMRYGVFIWQKPGRSLGS